MMRVVALLCLLWGLVACVSQPAEAPQNAELVLRGGRIATLDERVPQAQAIALRGGRIVALGSDAEIASSIGPDTQVIELSGRRVIPGIVESHAHLLGVGELREMLDLRAAQSWEEIVRAVEQAARTLPEGTWIRGRGWHQEKWSSVPADAVDGWPVRSELDRVAPRHPVKLEHASGHASIVNGAALERAGIAADRTDPPGGRILRDGSGKPTGVLNELASELVDPARGMSTAEHEAAVRRQVALAGAEALRLGITSFHTAGETLATVRVLRAMAEAGELPLRLSVMLSEPDEVIAPELARVRVIGAGDGMLTVRGIKRYADGALGSRGAWLLEPYSDAPENRGLPSISMESLERSAVLARDHGFQLCVHAIGDSANREVLDLFQRVIPSRDDLRAQRWRIEHAQHVDRADQPRFGELGVIAAVQTVHCISDGPWVPARIGLQRAANNAYPWRSLLNGGAVLCNGTDAPVEPLDPYANFHAAVTRSMSGGALFFPGEALSREQALRAATAAGAYAAFQERELGALSPGMRADLVVLNQDILSVPDAQLRDTRADLTILGGRIVYRAP